MTFPWVGCQQELGGLIENGEHSAAVRKLEAVAPSDPNLSRLTSRNHALLPKGHLGVHISFRLSDAPLGAWLLKEGICFEFADDPDSGVLVGQHSAVTRVERAGENVTWKAESQLLSLRQFLHGPQQRHAPICGQLVQPRLNARTIFRRPILI